MSTFFFEEQILQHFDKYVMKCTHNWLKRHNFRRIDDIWDDALQCARLGLLLYIRKQGITRAEDVFPDGGKLYWSIYNELSKGILMGVAVTGGIYRPSCRMKDTNFKTESLDNFYNDPLFTEDFTDDATLSVTAKKYITKLRDRERRIIKMKLYGYKASEIMRTLNMEPNQYYAAIERMKRQWAVMTAEG